MSKFWAILSFFVMLPLVLQSTATEVTGGKAPDWYMSAANPERNSHNSVEVRGNFKSRLVPGD